MRRNLLSQLIKMPAVAAITVALASSATVCLAGTQGQTKHRKAASHHTNYYQDKVGNSGSEIHPYQDKVGQIQWAPVGKPPGFTEP